MNKTNKIILFVLLACATSNSASTEDDPYYKHTGGSSSSCIKYGPSCSSQVPEVVAAQGESPDALQGAALKSVLNHWFSTKKELPRLNKEQQKAIGDLYKMLVKFKLSISDYQKERNYYYSFEYLNNGQKSEIIHDLRIMTTIYYGSIERSSRSEIGEGGFFNLFPKTQHMITNASDDHSQRIYHFNDHHKSIFYQLEKALSDSKFELFEEVIFNPEFPIDPLPTIIKEFIEKYKILHNEAPIVQAALDAHFQSIAEIDSALEAYDLLQKNVANLRASSKGINGE